MGLDITIQRQSCARIAYNTIVVKIHRRKWVHVLAGENDQG